MFYLRRNCLRTFVSMIRKNVDKYCECGLPRSGTWRKILYEPQPFPDNYVDKSFLIGLQKNVNVKSYGYFSVVCASFVISQQISIVTLLLVAFEYLYNENRFSNTQGLFIRYIKHLPFITVSSEPLEVLLIADSCLVAVLVYVVHRLADPSSSRNIISSSLKTIAILFGILLGLSPVLRTLTTSISNDTIWALSVFLLLFHLLFHDYSGGSLRFSAPASLNAAIFTTVLLSSRLETDLHVFAITFLAIELFVFSPLIGHFIRRYSPALYIVLTACILVATSLLLLRLSEKLCLLFLSAVLFITFICPFMLIWLQQYKKYVRSVMNEKVMKIVVKFVALGMKPNLQRHLWNLFRPSIDPSSLQTKPIQMRK